MLSVERAPAKHAQGLVAEVWSAGFYTNILVAVHISCSLGSEQRSILADAEMPSKAAHWLLSKGSQEQLASFVLSAHSHVGACNCLVLLGASPTIRLRQAK